MIRLFVADQSACTLVEAAPGDTIPPGTVWIDLLRPSEAERAFVEAALGVGLPTLHHMQEIEASSRTYSDDGAVILTTVVLARLDSEEPEVGVLTFVLTERALVTLRYIDPKPVDAARDRLARNPVTDLRPVDVLIAIVEALVDRMADALEATGSRIEAVSRAIFADRPAGPRRGRSRTDARRRALQEIGYAGDFVGKVRDSLSGIDRMTAFLAAAQPKLGRDAKLRMKTTTRDVRSLAQHADFLVQRLTFLLDATIGLISVDQNDIVKSFSVAATGFLPPTLIASIYGMNFELMPELSWPWGYPMALGLMLVSALLPLWYFRRKGWI